MWPKSLKLQDTNDYIEKNFIELKNNLISEIDTRRNGGKNKKLY